ncbi:MAG: AMP-binding protein [Deltaproteobacteria bacterium]|nr:AMP-binding protein [Deltaproteobacteria bacterium]
MKFTDDIFNKTQGEITRIQDSLLGETLDYVRKNSPFYAERFKDKPRLSGVEEITGLPLTSKEDLQRDNGAFLCVGKERVSEVVATTGTTGTQVFVWLTENDVIRVAENEKRHFQNAGFTPSDAVLLSVTLDNLFIAGMAYYAGLKRLGATVVRLGPQSPKKHLELFETLGPSGIVAVPSFVAAVYKQADKEGIPLGSLPFNKAVLIGETIRNADFTSNTLGNIVQRKALLETFSTYGLTEAAIAFCECPVKKGFHSNPDMVFAEVVDDEGRPVPDGAPGELVVTTFGVEATPLIRYCTGDVTFKIPGTCPCGRAGARIGPIIGRKAQRLKLKGTTVYPRTIENALAEIEGIENYVIEAYSGPVNEDRIVVKIGANATQPGLADTVREAIKAKARVTPQVEILTPGEVDKILFEGNRRKPLVFIDRRR